MLRQAGECRGSKENHCSADEKDVTLCVSIRPCCWSRVVPLSSPGPPCSRSQSPCHWSIARSLSPAVNISPLLQKTSCRVYWAACTCRTCEPRHGDRGEDNNKTLVRPATFQWITNPPHPLCRCSSLLASCRPLQAGRESTGEKEAASVGVGKGPLGEIGHFVTTLLRKINYIYQHFDTFKPNLAWQCSVCFNLLDKSRVLLLKTRGVLPLCFPLYFLFWDMLLSHWFGV